jgi:putative nucleotidyltransferase with HDIG domain
MLGTINAMARMVESRDPYTAGHQRRVARLAAAMAGAMGFPAERVDGVYMAGLIHDIGKIQVPAEILTKPGRLTKTEFDIIKTHCQVGFDIIHDIRFQWPIAQVVVQHHERVDGSGYPAGLSGEAVIPEARIIAVADVVEAMASHRPYREALGMDAALEEITKKKGALFDADAVEACVELVRDGLKLEPGS